MSYKPKDGGDRPKAVKIDKPHVGFTNQGSAFRSAEAIDNQPTNFVRWLLGEIADEYLSPADVRFLVQREPEPIRLCFRESTLASWEQLPRFWQWPCAGASTALEAAVQSHGGKRPWIGDEWAWTKRCDAAEAKHGYEVRPRDRGQIAGLLAPIIGRAPNAAEAVGSWEEESVPLEPPFDPDADIPF